MFCSIKVTRHVEFKSLSIFGHMELLVSCRDICNWWRWGSPDVAGKIREKVWWLPKHGCSWKLQIYIFCAL